MQVHESVAYITCIAQVTLTGSFIAYQVVIRYFMELKTAIMKKIQLVIAPRDVTSQSNVTNNS